MHYNNLHAVIKWYFTRIFITSRQEECEGSIFAQGLEVWCIITHASGDSRQNPMYFFKPRELITINYSVCQVVTLLFNIKDVILT